jgi:nicotinamide riboside transporter PnuC
MDIIAGIFELLAIWLVGSKNRLGFIAGLICNCLWIAYVLTSGQTYGLLIVVIPAIGLNVRGWLAWRHRSRGV